MLLFRWLLIMLLMVSVVSFAFYVGSGRVWFKQLGWKTLQWSVLAGLVFFATLLIKRIV